MDNQTSSGKNKFRIRLLKEEDFMSASDLIGMVAEEMHSNGKDTYLHNKTPDKIKESILDADNKMVGIFLLGESGDEEKLVAEMGYFGVDKNSPRNENGDYLPNFNANAVANEDIYYVGSVCVDKNFRGNRFFERMLHFLEERNEEDLLNGIGKTNSVAMVDINNRQSLATLLEKGYMLVQKTIDPSDKGKIFYLIKDVSKDKETPFEGHDIKINMNDKNYEGKSKVLLENGFVGAGFNRENKSIVFKFGNNVLIGFGCDTHIEDEFQTSTPILKTTNDEDYLGELAYA